MSRIRCFGGLVVGLVGFFSSAGSTVALEVAESPCPVIYEEVEAELNLGSVVDPPVVGNTGQFDPQVAYVAIGLSGNNAQIERGGDVALSLGAGSTPGSTTIRHLGSSSAARVAAALASSTTTYVVDGVASSTANYQGLRVAGLYEGVDLTYQLNSRQVILEYSADSAGALDQVRLSIGEGSSGKSGGALDRLTVTAETRQGDRLEMQTPAKGAAFGLAHRGLRPELPATARVVVTHGGFVDDFDAVRLADGELAVVTTAYNTLDGRGGSSAADLMLTRLSRDGDRLLSSLLVAGNGTDRGAAISADHNGQLVVAGTTDSADLGGGEGSRFERAFVLQASPDFGRVTRTVYLGGGAATAAADIAVNAAGEVLVLGSSATALPTEGSAIEFRTLFPATEGTPSATYFLTALDPHTLDSRALVPFTAVDLPSPPQVGFDEADLAVIGVSVGCGSVSVTCEYEMANNGSDYNTPWILGDQGSGIIEQWGHMALQWKAYKGYDYNPENAFPPSGSITGAELDAERLNQNEAEDAVFPEPGDPSGGWVVFESAGFGAAELAVGAALSMDWWTSPTFTSMSIDGNERPVGIRRVTFDVAGDNCLDVVCDPEGWNLIDDGNWQTNIVDNVDNGCAFNHDAEITIDGVELATWQPFFLNVSWAGVTFVNAYMPSRFEHVFDPPPGEESYVPHLAELSSRLRDHMFVTTDIISTLYRDGKPVAAETVAAKVRVADLPTP